MPAFSRTITDLCGDSIEVKRNEYDNVSLTIKDRGEEAVAELDAKSAVDIANALYEVAGRKVVDVEAASAENMSFNEGMLRLAAIHKRTVTFSYAKGKGEFIETRRLNPTSVQTTSSGDTVTRGLDPDREDTRLYRLDRIKGEVSLA